MNDTDLEWLETDGLGGFASHTVQGARTRRYHALLLVAKNPPVERRVLVNGADVSLDVDAETLALTSQTYAPPAEAGEPVIHHEGRPAVSTFSNTPWPTWTYQIGGGRTVVHSIFIPSGSRMTVMSWRLEGPAIKEARLRVRLFLSGRDYHSLHHENADFNFKPVDERAGAIVFRPYLEEPAVVAVSSGAFRGDGYWYRNFLYTEDRSRGLDCTEDLGSPGEFTFDLVSGEAVMVLGTESAINGLDARSLAGKVANLRTAEKARRAKDATAHDRAAGAYVADRGTGKTILAGYPWFTDWGRDTFIALRGLCLATGRLNDARRILRRWAGAVSEGMLPNRFPDSGEPPEFNSVDAALWFVIATHDLRAAEKRAGFVASTIEEWQLNAAIAGILRGYAAGTRHGIRMDEDRLLAAGAPGVQVTWMDAKVGDQVVTPRIGKPVEIQALWINALRIASSFDGRFGGWIAEAERSFAAKFWNENTGYLFDVVDADHVAGRLDGRIRPNALFAVGGLPYSILQGERARAIVDLAERKLLTIAGIRSLSPDEPQYRGRYQGGVLERDTAYHQGTVWPYLMGAFVEAWVRVRGDSDSARTDARRRFLAPLLAALDPLGLGHLPEIADGDAPHAPRGCPFQAWSLGEALRLDRVVLADRRAASKR